jgi:hypothetical protein
MLDIHHYGAEALIGLDNEEDPGRGDPDRPLPDPSPTQEDVVTFSLDGRAYAVRFS